MVWDSYSPHLWIAWRTGSTPRLRRTMNASGGFKMTGFHRGLGSGIIFMPSRRSSTGVKGLAMWWPLFICCIWLTSFRLSISSPCTKGNVLREKPQCVTFHRKWSTFRSSLCNCWHRCVKRETSQCPACPCHKIWLQKRCVTDPLMQVYLMMTMKKVTLGMPWMSMSMKVHQWESKSQSCCSSRCFCKGSTSRAGLNEGHLNWWAHQGEWAQRHGLSTACQRPCRKVQNHARWEHQLWGGWALCCSWSFIWTHYQDMLGDGRIWGILTAWIGARPRSMPWPVVNQVKTPQPSRTKCGLTSMISFDCSTRCFPKRWHPCQLRSWSHSSIMIANAALNFNASLGASRQPVKG